MMIPKTITDKLNEGRTYRDLQSIEARETETDEKIVEGYATVFDTPYILWQQDNYTVYEQIDAKAFNNCDMSDVIMQYNHEGRVFARIKNGTLEVKPDDKGLAIRADLGGTEIGRQLYTEIAGDIRIKCLSVSASARTKSLNTKTKKRARLQSPVRFYQYPNYLTFPRLVYQLTTRRK